MKRLIGVILAIILSSTVIYGQVIGCNRTVAINVSTATTLELIPAPPTGSIYVCGFNINASAGLTSVTGTDPAAGIEISETVPANAIWNLISLRVTLITSAVVANRSVLWRLDDGSIVFYDSPNAGVQAASSNIAYTLTGSGMNMLANGGSITAIPTPLTLKAGYRIKSITSLIDVGDNYGPPTYLVQEWSTFGFQNGTGANCVTGNANLTGIYQIQPGAVINTNGPSPIIIAPANNALCIINNRPTTLSGVLSYVIR